MNDEFDPMTWLVSCIEQANKSNNFKITSSTDGKSVRVLHRDSGAVWEFKVEVIRQPVPGM